MSKLHDLSFQWKTVFFAALVGGTWLLVLPQGIPWASLGLWSGAIMGRPVFPHNTGMWSMTILIHYTLAFLYAFAMMGLIWSRASRAALFIWIVSSSSLLYLLNFTAVHWLAPSLEGNEIWVFFGHLIFVVATILTHRAAPFLKTSRSRRSAWPYETKFHSHS